MVYRAAFCLTNGKPRVYIFNRTDPVHLFSFVVSGAGSGRCSTLLHPTPFPISSSIGKAAGIPGRFFQAGAASSIAACFIEGKFIVQLL